MSIVHDTDKTLRGAAESLSIQGAQIDSAMGTMLDIHNDLDVADGLMSGLESWFGKWKMPKEYNYVEPVFVSKDDISEVLEYEILYTKLQVGKAKQLHGRQETYPYKNGTKFTGNSNLSSGSSSGSGSQIQAIRTKEIVSEEEVQELSQVLGDLKNMALAVGQETDVQNEKLDKLTSSVNRANDRLEQTDHRIKRLL
ncbi:hypothetical protein KUTeg_008622 [Tegillarca granosa]|uniref:t-SNARE coiled-coil homology domain-containing protein n=1 Tax=Tegillarca granosa TaxID=220873 RepID=A0ABQ9F9N6_TEGGR|nr:hypothetical protein KUTeg_008622 [Tegillarca granosa]